MLTALKGPLCHDPAQLDPLDSEAGVLHVQVCEATFDTIVGKSSVRFPLPCLCLR